MDLEVGHVNLARGFRGGERQTELLVRELARRGVRQRVLVRRGSALPDRLVDDPGLAVREIPWPYLPFTGHLRGCHVIHGHDGRAPALTALASFRFGVPYVLTRRIQAAPGPTSLWAWRRASALAALSRGVADTLGAATGRSDVEIVPSALSHLPVDGEVAGRLRARWGDDVVVVCPAQLVPGQKGQEHLIDAARVLEAEGRPIRVVLLGRGEGEAVFRRRAEGLTSVEFGGFVDDLGNWLAAADALVLPSLHEGLGSVILDGMDAGLPVVASDIPGIRDVVRHGDTGLLVPPADPAALADALRRLLDDRSLARRLGAAGRIAARSFTPERMADRYLEIYRGVVRGGAS